jgi:hypothetical protein
VTSVNWCYSGSSRALRFRSYLLFETFPVYPAAILTEGNEGNEDFRSLIGCHVNARARAKIDKSTAVVLLS